MRFCMPLLLLTSLVVTLGGCNRPDSSRKPTFPLTGTVLVDGAPAAEVLVNITDTRGLDEAAPTFSSAYTDAKGKFQVSTYDLGDGVPEGDYIVTFTWGQVNPMTMQYGGPDKLEGKYDDPENSEFHVKVQPGIPTDMGKIQLTTK